MVQRSTPAALFFCLSVCLSGGLSVGAVACRAAGDDPAGGGRTVARSSALTLVPTQDGVDSPVLGGAPNPSLPSSAWDGQRFWLTWNDNRTANLVVAATRIDSGGAILDGVNLTAPQPPGQGQYGSRIACGGGVCLAVWLAVPNIAPCVEAARFDLNGVLLDAAPLLLTPPDSDYDATTPDVAFDGTEFVAAWIQTTSSEPLLEAARVTTAGAIVDTPPKRVSASTATASPYAPRLIDDGTDLVLAWEENSLNVFFVRLAPDLTARDAAPVAVGAGSASGVTSPALASDGAGFLIAWAENDTAAGGPAVKAQRWGADATPASAAITVETSRAGAISPIGAAYDGARFTLAWSRGSTDADVFAAQLDATGAAIGGVLTIDAGIGSQNDPTVSASGGRTLIAWISAGNLVETILDATGAALAAPARAALSLNQETLPAVAWTGSGFTVTWLDTRDGAARAYGMTLDQDAAPLRAQAFAISGAALAASNLKVASDGALALAAWSVGYTSPQPAHARPFDATGAPVGAEVEIASGDFTPRSMAFGGGVYLIVGDYESPSGAYQSLGVRVDSNGQPLDSSPFVIAAGQQEPQVASDGSGFLVVFRPSTTAVAGVRVDAAGQVVDATPLNLFPAGAEPTGAASIAYGGGVYLIAWDDLKLFQIGGARVNPDGTLVDTSVLAITSQSDLDAEENPVVTFDGAKFVVAWRDTLFDSNFNDIADAHKYTTITPAGVTGGAGTLATLTRTDSLLNPIGLAGGGGRTLAAYQTLDTTPPYPINRVKLRYLAPAAAPIGGRCPINAGCVTGAVCADSLCCQSACAGGAADCQACSVVAGAAQNGTCGALAEGAACATAGMCAAGICISPPDAGTGNDAAVDAVHPSDGPAPRDAGNNQSLDGGGTGTGGADAARSDAADMGSATDAGGGASDAGGSTEAGAKDAGRDLGAAPDAGTADVGGGKPGGGSGGCGCEVAAPGGSGFGLGVAGGVALIAVYARRRRSASCASRSRSDRRFHWR